jgi:tRNA threonylcarbamoyladenosine biosynthesis protein TsaB
MLVLGLDTALKRCSVAILRGETVLADFADEMERGHAERLAPMADAALREAGVRISDLDRVGVVVGPGGFTGVRVALAFARGLGIGTGVPVVGVTSLAALAANLGEASGALLAPVIDARRGQVYAGLYETPSRALLGPFVAAPEEALRRLGHRAGGRAVATIGDGAALLPSSAANWRASNASSQIDAKAIARLAAVAAAPEGPPRPLYLRAPDAKPQNPARPAPGTRP